MPPNITVDELRLIKEHLLLPYVVRVLERAAALIAKVFKTPGPYRDLLSHAAELAHTDALEVRKELRKHGIAVYDEQLTSEQLYAAYKCRGYQDYVTLLKGVLQASIELRMRRYLGEDMSKYQRPDTELTISSDDASGVLH